MITYRETLETITVDQLEGFFAGWLNPPTKETLFEILTNSDEIILAIDEESKSVVGFITAITDHVLAAYIPFVEVIQEFQDRGIGKELVRQMLDKFSDLYMIDLLCDEHLQAFYRKLGMSRAVGMMVRNYMNQSGERAS